MNILYVITGVASIKPELFLFKCCYGILAFFFSFLCGFFPIEYQMNPGCNKREEKKELKKRQQEKHKYKVQKRLLVDYVMKMEQRSYCMLTINCSRIPLRIIRTKIIIDPFKRYLCFPFTLKVR